VGKQKDQECVILSLNLDFYFDSSGSSRDQLHCLHGGKKSLFLSLNSSIIQISYDFMSLGYERVVVDSALLKHLLFYIFDFALLLIMLSFCGK